MPTDEEIVWVGYDPSGAPTDIWTYWHGKVLHTDWRDRGTPAIDVQWGKHGSCRAASSRATCPRFQTLNAFYAFHQLAVVGHPPRHGSRVRGRRDSSTPTARYRDFSRILRLGDSLDVVVRSATPNEALAAVFGKPYSRKVLWP